jgi:acetoin utilization deacetylase AcuC-like enzyme
MIGEQVRGMAEVCEGREIDLIASGYTRHILPPAWLALICGLAGIDIELEEPEPVTEWSGDRFVSGINVVVQTIKDHLKEYWHCLR